MIRRAAASRILSSVGKSTVPVEQAVLLSRSTFGNIRTMASKAITIENINPNILKLEYAVRGPLVIRAAEIEKELEKVRITILIRDINFI